MRAARPNASANDGRSRGAVLVEAAISVPLFMMVIFAIIEMSLMYRDHLTVANAARDGARVAAAAGDDLDADFRILQTVKLSSAVVHPTNVERIVVYRASGPGEEPSATCKSGAPGPADDCNVYLAADFDRTVAEFGCITGTATDLDHNYCPAERPVSLASIGYVGVWVKVKYPAITSFFGGDRHLTNAMVMRIEPRRVA